VSHPAAVVAVDGGIYHRRSARDDTADYRRHDVLFSHLLIKYDHQSVHTKLFRLRQHLQRYSSPLAI